MGIGPRALELASRVSRCSLGKLFETIFRDRKRDVDIRTIYLNVHAAQRGSESGCVGIVLPLRLQHVHAEPDDGSERIGILRRPGDGIGGNLHKAPELDSAAGFENRFERLGALELRASGAC